MTYKTSIGRRPDLENMPVPGLEKLIANKIFPVQKVANKSGKAYFRSLVTKVAASTDQRQAGTAPETTYLTATNKDFSVSPVEKRYGLEYHEVDNYGGIEATDNAGGEGAKTSVIEAIENQAVAIVLGGAGTAVTDEVIRVVDQAKKKVKRYAGRLVVIMSEECYGNVMTYPDIRRRLRSFTSVQPADNEQILTLNRVLLAMVLGVEEVIIGDDEYWGAIIGEGAAAVNYAERMAIARIAPDTENSHRMKPVYGKDITYFPSDETRFEVSSFPDDNEKANKYDGTAWHQYMVYNPGACQVLTGITRQDILENEEDPEDPEEES